ncbi:MAG: Ig-like domain-containing protein [Synergistaceae bacterium]|nr:Ig-like domain-containing protein [Synergistaceae bacterium]NLD98164.1 Ig domain-containing protein [Synergistaceae bacterium]
MRLKVFLAVFLLLFVLSGLSNAEIQSGIRLDRETARVEVGKSVVVRALPTGSGDVWWNSSDTSVADFVTASDGLSVTVRGWRTGTAVISVHFSPYGSEVIHSASCQVTVAPNSNPYRVAAVRISPETLVVEKGRPVSLTATVVPETATNKNVTWRTSNSYVASVSSQGVVNGLAQGHTVVSVRSDDGGFVAECSVDVVDYEIRVNGISLNHTTTDVNVDGTRYLVASISPANATNKRVRWVTSNWEIASVSQNGIVVGVRKGRAIISAITEDGGFVAECLVSVNEGWLDFIEGCSALNSSPFSLLLLIPLLSLIGRRK